LNFQGGFVRRAAEPCVDAHARRFLIVAGDERYRLAASPKAARSTFLIGKDQPRGGAVDDQLLMKPDFRRESAAGAAQGGGADASRRVSVVATAAQTTASAASCAGAMKTQH
jgi:hypothetical protein